MSFLFHNLEELYSCRGDGRNGDIAATFPDPQTILVDGIHRNRSGTDTLERALLEGPYEPNERTQAKAHSTRRPSTIIAHTPDSCVVLAELSSMNGRIV